MNPSPESKPAAPADSQPEFIRLNQVTKRWPNGSVVLNGLDLSVERGEFISLIGPSGCGKSTLLRLLSGLSPLTSGSIRLDGMNPDNAREIMSFIFQDATLLPWRTVQGNVELGLELEGRLTRDQRRERATKLIELVGLSAVAGHYPRQLSGGMRMRVSIARGLVTQPQLLLMDEPFGALDEITRNRLDADLLDLWQRQKLTVVFVTHSIHEAVFLSQRVVVMAARPGRIVEEFTIDEPYPRTADFRVSTAFSRHAKQLQDSLLRASGGEADLA
jgi:NitT/TauT family transport system ATP-binding protein